jgi:drug/metabolite transporter (DMT)-like permease
VARGILLAVVATLLYNAGFIVQKAAFRRRPASLPRMVTNPLWIGGLALTTAGLGCQVLVLSLLPLTVAQPIGLCGVVIVLLLSRLVLGERTGARATAGLALVVAAMVLLAASLDPQSDRPGTGGRLLTLAAVALPSILVALLVAGRGHRAAGSPQTRRRSTGAVHGLAAGLLYGVAALGVKGLAVASAGGILAAVISPYGYLLVVATGLGFLVFQSGLRLYPASIVVPVSNVVANLYAVAAGTIVFAEPLPAGPVRLVLRTAAFTAAAAALVLLCTTATDPMERATPSELPQREHTDPER